ncbi:sigma-70 family RNA polymerase sigma factor [Streptomyces gamaensis]|uniref:Sigma-70 family RNA polymerase sigma factor n=1 Tax=Streptomyces gamaensis TaxID=1763542 RepID=A0ABW0Z4I3_9ACTN
MTRRPEHPMRGTGADRVRSDSGRGPHAARTADHTLGQRPPLEYEPYLDGLFTYCLSVLCEHGAAAAALGEALAAAERRADRAPGEELRRSWLYALARWACLRRLADPDARQDPPPAGPDDKERAELARLAWPEAAGTTPVQREALELAVRHGLAAHEVAAVLGLEPDPALTLLSSAACEVERTRTALAVVESGRCPVVARFAGDSQVLLSAALRRELVRHVDECAECRRTAERATAGEPWPGTAASTAALPVLTAPAQAVAAARAAATGTRGRRGPAAAPVPRFDRRGFPQDPKERSARRGRLRGRAVTLTVVTTVVCAPVLALWAACRGAPATPEGHEAPRVSAKESSGLTEYPYEEAAQAGQALPGGSGPFAKAAAGARIPDVSVAVSGPDGTPLPVPDGGGASPAPPGAAPTLPGLPAPVPGPGRLTVEAQPSGTATLITLTASGGASVHWSLTTDAPWLLISRTSGELRPGESVTVAVRVDAARQPVGHWSARVTVEPGGTAVTIEGRGTTPEPTPTSAPPSPSPAAPTQQPPTAAPPKGPAPHGG